MYRVLWFFIIIVVSFVLVSCTPIGTIHGDDPGTDDVDDFWTVPQRVYYLHGDDFVRDSDLRVFASHQGMVESIPINKVVISLLKNPDDDEPNDFVTIANGEYTLTNYRVGTGRKLIFVSYGGKTDKYSIEVGSRGVESGSAGPIYIEWAK